MNNAIVTLKVDKFYNETCDDNYKHLYKDETIDSNFNKGLFFFLNDVYDLFYYFIFLFINFLDELTGRIPMSNASDSDSL